MMNSNSIVQKRQQPLMDNYVKNPKAAWITDVAVIESENLNDEPFHTHVIINEELEVPFEMGIHRAVGGLHDYPNPGDMLCASLASCFDTTLRLIADRLSVKVEKARIKASAEVDVRGTLMVDREVPVNFQSMKLEVDIQVAKDTREDLVQKLLKGSEHCCIVYQTIKKGIPIEVKTNVAYGGEERKAA